MTINIPRLRSEQEFHDRQAEQRAVALCGRSLHFDDDAYLDHASWIRPAFARLGDVRGRRVLDLGCGHGMAAVVLARHGALVTALDLSAGYLREAAARARANGVALQFVQADGERLPFRAGAFDAVWGNAVLHHFDLRRAARELVRVLAPGGVGVFCEPWGENPLLNWARRCWPYPGKGRTRDEAPLCQADLTPLRDHFRDVHVEGHELLAMAARALSWRRGLSGLVRCDRALLARWPRWRHWCRYAVIALRKAT